MNLIDLPFNAMVRYQYGIYVKGERIDVYHFQAECLEMNDFDVEVGRRYAIGRFVKVEPIDGKIM